MAQIFSGASTTIDESLLQQNNGSPSVPGDADDNDLGSFTLGSTNETLSDFVDTLLANEPLNTDASTDNDVSVLEIALSGYDGTQTDLADTSLEAITLTDTSTVDALRFSQADGSAFPVDGGSDPGIGSGLTTADGDAIYLFQDPTGQFIVGREADGTLAFLLHLDINDDFSGARIWTVLFQPLGQPDITDPDDSVDLDDIVFVTADESESFSAANAPAGNNLFITFANQDGTIGVVATGETPANQSTGAQISSGETVNTSSFDVTTFGNSKQMIDPTSALVFTFVRDPLSDFTTPLLDQGEADIEEEIQFSGGAFDASSAAFQIVQLQGGKTTSATVTAYDDDDIGIVSSHPAGGGTFDANTVVAAGAYTITDASGSFSLTTSETTLGSLIGAINGATNTTGVTASLGDGGDLILQSGTPFTLSGFGDLSTSLADGEYTTGTQFVDGILDLDAGQIVQVTSITITRIGGTKQSPEEITLETVFLPETGLTVEDTENNLTYVFNADGSVEVIGLRAGDTVAYTTDGDHNRLKVTNSAPEKGSGSASFDIGGFRLTNTGETKIEVGDTLFFEDDGPALPAGSPLVVDEHDLANAQSTGNDDTDAPEADHTDADGNVTVYRDLAEFGTPSVDGPTVFTASADLTPLTALTETSRSAAIVWSTSSGVEASGTFEGNPAALAGGHVYSWSAGSDSAMFTVPGGGDTLEALVAAIDASNFATASLDGTTVTIRAINGEALTLGGFEGGGGFAAGLDVTYADWPSDPTVIISSDPGAQDPEVGGSHDPLATGLALEDGTDFTITVGANAATYSATSTSTLADLIAFFDSQTDSSAEAWVDLELITSGDQAGDLRITSLAAGAVFLEGFSAISPALADGEYVAISGSVISITSENTVALGDSLDTTAAWTLVAGTNPAVELVAPGATATVEDLVDAINATGFAAAYVISGELVVESLNGTTLGFSGFTGIGIADDAHGVRDVVTYQLTSLGATTFRLIDQWDHAAGDGENIADLDFSGLLTAADPEGDPVSVTDISSYNIRDDVPVASGSTLSAAVDEDALGNQTAAEAGASPAVPNDPSPDRSTGNTDAVDLVPAQTARPEETDGTGFDAVAGSLASLVSVGADEFPTFSLNGSTASLDTLASPLTSRAATLVFAVSAQNDLLTGGVVSVDSDPDDTRPALSRDHALGSLVDGIYTVQVGGETLAFDVTTDGTTLGEWMDWLNASASNVRAYLKDGDLVVDSLTGDAIDLAGFAANDAAFDALGDGEYTATRTVFALSVAANGDWLFDLEDQLDQPGTDTVPTSGLSAFEDTIEIPLGAMIVVTDHDGDSLTLPAKTEGQETFKLVVRDDVPVVTGLTNVIFANGSVGVGLFDYAIGADERGAYTASESDFANMTLAGMFGEQDIADASVQWAGEDDTTAAFDFAFDYVPDAAAPEDTDTATGTITFDKIAGTYTVTFDGVLTGFTVVNTGNTVASTGYNLVGTPQQSEIVVSDLTQNANNPFWVRFMGDHVTNGANGVLLTAAGNGDGGAYSAGEVFAAKQTYATISNAENGVAGDTIQPGEVLDLNFHLSDPGAGGTPPLSKNDPAIADGRADGIYLKFDNIGTTEDLLLLLKLVDDDTGLTTTRMILIDAADIAKNSTATDATLPPALGLSLDNNDGAVVVEANDYNIGATDDYRIFGAQILTSTQGIGGSGIELNPVTGDAGGSSSTRGFGPGDNDNDVVKITDIGFIVTESGTQDADLELKFAIVDADGDATAEQQIDIFVEGSDTLSAQAAGTTAEANWLHGGSGEQTLTGGSAPDGFVFLDSGDGPDTIEFVPGSDMLVISAAGFGGIDEASDIALDTGTWSNTLEDRFLFDDDDRLWFDPDGNDPTTDPVHLATLPGAGSLGAEDFVLIA